MQAAVVTDFGADGVQQVQEAQVDGVDFIRAVVAQNRIHGPDGILVVMAVPAIANFQMFAGVGVEKLEGPFAPLFRAGRCIQGFGQDQSGGQQGAQLEKTSAGEMGAVVRPGRRRLRSHCFSHASHPIVRSWEVNGRSRIRRGRDHSAFCKSYAGFCKSHACIRADSAGDLLDQ